MPKREKTEAETDSAGRPLKSFRKRYDEAEAQRERLMQRLSNLGAAAARHPGYGRARTLLNDAFRRSSLAQRAAVLQAANWLIDVLEQLTLSV